MKIPKFNLRKIRGFIFRHKISTIVVLVAVLLSLGTIWYFLGKDVSYIAPGLVLNQKVDDRVEAPLTGEKVAKDKASRRAVSVVIENFPDARPQSGYADADIVYETIAEGGITRTLAVFQSKDSSEIGPVRSARPAFVEWMLEYGALFAHVGGSDEALALISQLKPADLNQFYNSNYFWRSNDRYAPHNVYTTTDKLYAAAKANGYDTTKAPAAGFKFADDAKEAQRPKTASIKIDFSYYDYLVNYLYDAKTNTYQRSVSGEKAIDRKAGTQIAPKNVIAIYANMTPYVNSSGKAETDIEVVGSGTGYLFQNGTKTTINWTKSSRSAATKFTDASGNDIKLVRGQTWIEVVPSGKSISE